MRTVAIIQARMGSTRLPGKVMMKILDKTVLEHVIYRVLQAKEIDDIVIATTTKSDDDIIVKEANRLGVKHSRGSEEDVLSRYYHAAIENKVDIVVRITSDCPLIDPQIIDEMVMKFKKLYNEHKVDYLSNTQDRTFPRGLDVEIFPFNILEETFCNAEKLHQREHVTPYIYENKDKFKLENYLNKIDYSSHRWTLDTPEDYEMIKMIYEGLNDCSSHTIILFQDIIEYLELYPEIALINSNINQKIF